MPYKFSWLFFILMILATFLVVVLLVSVQLYNCRFGGWLFSLAFCLMCLLRDLVSHILAVFQTWFLFCPVFRYLDYVSGLVSFFSIFSYVSRLCLGPGVFLLVIFLGISAVFWTWSFPSDDFLMHSVYVSDLAYSFARFS